MTARFMLFLSILSVGFPGVVDAAQAQTQPEVPTDVIKRVTSDGRNLAWGGIRIGMSLHEAETVLHSKLNAAYENETGCGGIVAETKLHGTRVTLDISGLDPGSVVQGIQVPLSGSAKPEAIRSLVASLKKRVPSLVYQPSRHAPEMTEKENPNPVYVLKTNPQMAILVKPEIGLILSREDCLD